MMAGTGQADHFELAGIAVDRRSLTLAGPNGESRLEPKVMEVLGALAETPGRVWTRSELIDRVWGVTFGGDESLTRAVSLLRKALREPHGLESAIRTVSKSGYLLTDTIKIEAKSPFNKAQAIVGSIWPESFDDCKILAVLPFEAGSEEREDRLFADGLSEEILLSMNRIEGIRVIARASSFQFRGERKSIDDLRALLAADYVLDGTVRRYGDRVRIGVELIETVERTALWSAPFEFELQDLDAAHREIASAVARSLNQQLAAVRPRGQADADAVALHMKGRALLGPIETYDECIALFAAAVERDPNYGAAWSSLAYARGVATRFGKRQSSFSHLAKGVRDAAEFAMQFDPSSGNAHLALGFLEPIGQYDAFERCLERAELADKNDVRVLNQRSIFEYNIGRIRSSFLTASKCNQIDPLNLNIAHHYANLLADIGFESESVEAFIVLHRRSPNIWGYLGVPLLRSAMCDDWETVDRLLPIVRATGLKGLVMPQSVVAALRDPTQRVRNEVRESCEGQLARNGYVQTSSLIYAYNIGLADDVFAWVAVSDFGHLFEAESAPPESRGFMQGAMFSRSNRKMQRDARFPALCQKLGLNRYWLESDRWPDCAAEDLPYDFKAECAHAAKTVPVESLIPDLVVRRTSAESVTGAVDSGGSRGGE